MNLGSSFGVVWFWSVVLAIVAARIGSEDVPSSEKKRPRHSGRLLGRPGDTFGSGLPDGLFSNQKSHFG
jgi:hypothetical protein